MLLAWWDTVSIPCTDAPVCHNVSQCFKSDTIICHQRPKILINAASRKKWDWKPSLPYSARQLSSKRLFVALQEWYFRWLNCCSLKQKLPQHLNFYFPIVVVRRFPKQLHPTDSAATWLAEQNSTLSMQAGHRCRCNLVTNAIWSQMQMQSSHKCKCNTVTSVPMLVTNRQMCSKCINAHDVKRLPWVQCIQCHLLNRQQ